MKCPCCKQEIQKSQKEERQKSKFIKNNPWQSQLINKIETIQILVQSLKNVIF